MDLIYWMSSAACGVWRKQFESEQFPNRLSFFKTHCHPVSLTLSQESLPDVKLFEFSCNPMWRFLRDTTLVFPRETPLSSNVCKGSTTSPVMLQPVKLIQSAKQKYVLKNIFPGCLWLKIDHRTGCSYRHGDHLKYEKKHEAAYG